MYLIFTQISLCIFFILAIFVDVDKRILKITKQSFAPKISFNKESIMKYEHFRNNLIELSLKKFTFNIFMKINYRWKLELPLTIKILFLDSPLSFYKTKYIFVFAFSGTYTINIHADLYSMK